MTISTDRRRALQTLGVGLAAAGAVPLSSAAAAKADDSLAVPGAKRLRELMARLEKAPRRRDFKTVPMILDHADQWDAEAIAELKVYKPRPKQAWDCTDIGGPWLNLMRNALNAQIWSFGHPDFLAVAVVHGSANLALYDQAMWDKYGIAKLAGDKFPKNALIVEVAAGSGDPKNYEDEAGAFSPHDNSIPALMRRGVFFLSCHNAIWEQSSKLHAKGQNPDKLSVDQIAAELTNHLLPGVVLTPGAVGTMPELQEAGFHYAKN
ncbi:MAG: transcriptional initiation protein Tat [Alphaproteobacteria bacterium]|nr:transcriptional initiation protein Tat [Alphaproteobacteria bacterium]MBU6472865.1 transcriptional initiation protein Tat [Alphaproteobacteria bacterium]MDE2012958.1 transcriptional initiation protein Tat [Alphaproteobacteria bacterium]MDE2074597.1 transcriptional initiation protein Tat [Alphaproteobacteria bacterium]MDE2351433.1 transcriptional initiation protein Tat [Alphaproteobacteria bacterium]